MPLTKIRNAVRFVVASLSFPLPVDNFVAAKMSMTAVYPRPDVETQTHARHRLMHTQMPYEIPIGVQGGAWPFQYSIISAPSGSTLGLYVGDTDYGVLKIPAQASGTHSITVRVTDQELNTVDLSWDIVVDDSAFTFLDSTTGTSGVGSISDPLKLFADYYLGDEDDTTYADQVLVFRAGSYTVIGAVSDNDNVEMNTGVKSPTMINFPTEVAVLDYSGAKILTRGGTNVEDVFVYGLTHENARTDVGNSHFFWCTNVVERLTFANNYFDTIGAGTAGSDNPAAVFISDTSTEKEYILYKLNTHDNFSINGSNGSYFDFYNCSYVLAEENKAINSSTTYGYWPKGTTGFVTLRANECWDNNTGAGISVGYGAESISTCHDHEVCWNRIVLPTGNQSGRALLWAMANGYEGTSYNSYLYRNTFVNGSSWMRFPGVADFDVQGNVIVSDMLSRWDTAIMNEITTNITAAETANVTTDSTGLLIGTARTNYLGTKGHEVSD